MPSKRMPALCGENKKIGNEPSDMEIFLYIYYDTIGRAPSELSVTLANKDSNVLLLLADVELKEGTSQLKLEVNLRFLLFQSRFSGIGI